MPTAYLSPSLLQDLTNVSVSPGAGNTGYPLVWNNTSGRFELAVLGVAGGGTGTSNGSITGTGALTFAAGGTNQSITLQPSGTGTLNFGSSENPILGTFNLLGGNVSSGFNINLPATTASFGRGIYLRKGEGYFAAINRTGVASAFVPTFVGRNVDNTLVALQFLGESQSQTPGVGAIFFAARDSNDTGGISSGGRAFYFANGYSGAPNYFECLLILGNGDSTFFSTTESTSTTTGAVRINGGLGVVKNVNIGGNLRFAGGTVPATAASAGTTGDIRYDGSHLYICTATNTWVRTALSTW